eukprot:TRINITY_DN7445_c0_g1_i2.p1 TRINITY_DN7445_c0_g1~~TRINITY_DN7445_c0_g1_i2.p1  ORF type:complete len:238 (+),score=39.11 TRINITY_DN7445_c0_g1_i2:488-1201(+)
MSVTTADSLPSTLRLTALEDWEDLPLPKPLITTIAARANRPTAAGRKRSVEECNSPTDAQTSSFQSSWSSDDSPPSGDGGCGVGSDRGWPPLRGAHPREKDPSLPQISAIMQFPNRLKARLSSPPLPPLPASLAEPPSQPTEGPLPSSLSSSEQNQRQSVVASAFRVPTAAAAFAVFSARGAACASGAASLAAPCLCGRLPESPLDDNNNVPPRACLFGSSNGRSGSIVSKEFPQRG